ncbi:MAG: hypothetical protein QOF62_192 [Pyrinomonadaceae bacterium]|jgi:hypothetical protein|nr:hypothetical protein [Pyrinomonadaceae bacterium]
MKSSSDQSSSLSKKWFLVLVLIPLCIVIGLVAARSKGVAQSTRTNGRVNGKLLADKESPQERLSFRENGPTGYWSGSIIPDQSRNSSTSPVVVVGTSALMGDRQMRNMQLTHVTLRNYSSKTVLGVQLKWFVTTREDRFKVLPPPGYTGLFEAYTAPGTSRKVESPLVRFSQAVKYLVKDGSLEGNFLLQVRVFEAEFEDGTSWNDYWGGPKPGDQGEPWKGPGDNDILQNHATLPGASFTSAVPSYKL